MTRDLPFYSAQQGPINGRGWLLILGTTLLAVAVLMLNPDGTPDVSYSKRGGGNGVCALVNNEASSGTKPSGGMNAKQMSAYCKGEASGQHNTRPSNVTASAPMKGANGGFVVTGSVSLGAKGNPRFQCLFDRKGKFKSIEWL